MNLYVLTRMADTRPRGCIPQRFTGSAEGPGRHSARASDWLTIRPLGSSCPCNPTLDLPPKATRGSHRKPPRPPRWGERGGSWKQITADSRATAHRRQQTRLARAPPTNPRPPIDPPDPRRPAESHRPTPLRLRFTFNSASSPCSLFAIPNTSSSFAIPQVVALSIPLQHANLDSNRLGCPVVTAYDLTAYSSRRLSSWVVITLHLDLRLQSWQLHFSSTIYYPFFQLYHHGSVP
ncbi:hypothetical protein B0I35DRAFT_6531 [Stachybotrys elegans]|uniref:Uncharacterized protein n=1 Tax=Stachybotrys elegans TaxID=80388 RepID=A0A8K0T015_9HYPO|nr:hypothetical protein B0I35DRAFT_6531 [Stachybotrys elegans]